MYAGNAELVAEAERDPSHSDWVQYVLEGHQCHLKHQSIILKGIYT